MLKIVTLMKRRSGLSVDDFQKHLRDTHGPLAAKGPGLRRCMQSCALPQGYSKGELLFDAIEEMWFDSQEAYERYHGSVEFAASKFDVKALVRFNAEDDRDSRDRQLATLEDLSVDLRNQPPGFVGSAGRADRRAR